MCVAFKLFFLLLFLIDFLDEDFCIFLHLMTAAGAVACFHFKTEHVQIWIPVPPPGPLQLVRTADKTRSCVRACVRACSPPHLRRAAARPGQPAGIYWLAQRLTAGRLVRSVLTTSALQRHLWTINSDTKAERTTAEPTHGASWCFGMRLRGRKRLCSHWQFGFGEPVPFGCHPQGTESENGNLKTVRLLREEEYQEDVFSSKPAIMRPLCE